MTQDNLVGKVEEMRHMSDEVLVSYYNVVSNAAWESRRKADYDNYKYDKRMLDLTAGEILERMKIRHIYKPKVHIQRYAPL